MQLALTLAAVGLAALYLARSAWLTFRPRAGRGCGCAGAKPGCPAASEAVRRLQAAARAGPRPSR